jgi:hypothetical protein
LPPDIASFLKYVNIFLSDFEHWWKTPLVENYSTLLTIKEDLHTLKQNCEHIHLMLSQPITIGGTDFPTLFSALEFVSSNKTMDIMPDASTVSELNELRSLVDAIPSVMNQCVLVEDFHNVMDAYDLSGIQDTLKKWEQRFSVISVGLHQVKTLFADVNQLQTRLNAQPGLTGIKSHPLLQRLNSSRPPSPAFGPASDHSADLIARLNTAKTSLFSWKTEL